ncbi:hypothetical protein Tco_0799888 [Tanacetum coccineum]|uniref:Uncharacterized protein n=1 Tax=Tanacetum coccineum TaxID=301880 RepID=A0ABQ4ZVB1_9ASTR
MWNDLILAHEGPSDIRDTKIAALRLKIIVFKSLEGEKVNGTFTRLKCLLNDLENNGVIIPEAEDSDSDVEEDQRTNKEFLADLNAVFHERALLEYQKRFYKRSGRLGSARKPIDKSKETYFACGKTEHPSDTNVFTMKMEILLEPASNKLLVDIRSQDGKDDKDNDKGSKSRSQSMKEQAYNEDKDQEHSSLNDKSNLTDLMKECKAKRSSFKTKNVPSSKGRLNLLHTDLCGPMRIESINGKKYIMVIEDDYS